MAVPRNRISNSRKNTRRAHDAKKPSNIVRCSDCDSPRLPHRVCPECGRYGGKVIISKETEE